MHQAAISLEEFAAIFEGITDRTQTDAGAFFVTTGRHADLGALVVIQDPFPGLVLMSELPFQGADA